MNHVISSKDIGIIAENVPKWQGRIADELGLTATDVESIKAKYPADLKLQTYGFIIHVPMVGKIGRELNTVVQQFTLQLPYYFHVTHIQVYIHVRVTNLDSIFVSAAHDQTTNFKTASIPTVQ